MRIAIGSDHCGYTMKMQLLPLLQAEHEVTDYGCYSADMVDFPDIARKICGAILRGEADRGIMFCSTGCGAVIACNKIRGIRAALCHDTYCAHQCVEHDDVQVLAIGSEVIGFYTAREVISAFLNAQFCGEEEFRIRLAKLDQLEAENGGVVHKT
ncbi:MAG: RpiB/LacA/LacB family sugar-phosphate isomerase [Lachnospiraceae bacterium]|nr:RpiB/LacA/LacB family sugar-phosphate isomerase [Lachnospiraceae bacterium]